MAMRDAAGSLFDDLDAALQSGSSEKACEDSSKALYRI
jgi:hypothetical protein